METDKKQNEQKPAASDLKCQLEPLPLKKAMHLLELAANPPSAEAGKERTVKVVRKKEYPQDSPPKSLYLPYFKPYKDFGRYVEANCKGSSFGILRERRQRPNVPGWLIALDTRKLRGILKLKELLQDTSSPCELIGKIHYVIRRELQLEVPKSDIGQVMLTIPLDVEKGPSFSHFMYTMGNYERAFDTFTKEFGYLFKNLNICPPDEVDEEESEGEDQGSGDDEEEQPTKLPKRDKKYTYREQIFYSGLLILQMYETLQGVEDLYVKGHIPEPLAFEERLSHLYGKGPNGIGVNNRPIAAWDTPPPPISKISPYAQAVAFVTNRLNIRELNMDKYGKFRSYAKVQPLYMAIRPPRKESEACHVRIMENRERIRRALRYLAANGDCVAMLPDIHLVIHLSDTFVDRLETVEKRTDGCNEQDRIFQKEVNWIGNTAKAFYRPVALPPQFTTVKSGKNLIPFTAGLKLRSDMDRYLGIHWSHICRQKHKFRELLWNIMHPERIPAGVLRDSFTQTFCSYITYNQPLTILKTTYIPY